jgi:hypothetical protein
MIDEGLLILAKGRPYPWYEITPKGRSYLKIFAEMQDDL